MDVRRVLCGYMLRTPAKPVLRAGLRVACARFLDEARLTMKPIFMHAALCAMACTVAACGNDAPTTDPAADVAAIRALLDRVESTFKTGDLDAAMTVFTDDAAILGQGAADIVGADAIRATYAGMMQQLAIDAELTTAEIQVAGDLAYERGTYTLKLTDKASGQAVSTVTNRHLHILKRQPDGSWKTWRMMVNSPQPAPPPQ